MYRHRNRPAYTPEQLQKVYANRYDHTRWEDHIERVKRTIAAGRWLVDRYINFHDPEEFTLADLSCGDSAIAMGIQVPDPVVGKFYLGDYCEGYPLTGPIEKTIHQIQRVQLFILSETLEHLDDPELVLREIRAKSEMLLLTTPKMFGPDDNIEHYWSWSDEAVRAMLVETGWTPVGYEESYTGLGYTYQIWSCE